ncbi:MAG TPA: ATP-binding protein [Burkholderiales bacterium]|nr:ATP-binding protein [Burkholderiales bacterium]
MTAKPRPFNLLRWFALLSLITIAVGAIGMATILSHFLAEEVLRRDAMLTSQFIASAAENESDFFGFSRRTGLAEVLGGTADHQALGVPADSVERALEDFYGHIRLLPDVLLANIYARDQTVVWSHNRSAIGTRHVRADELEQAFRSRILVAHGFIGRHHHTQGQFLLGEPERYYVENYIPLYDSHGNAVAVVEIYKEPSGLFSTIRRGQMLVWISSLLGGALMYLTLFWVVRRASSLIDSQQKQIVESEMLVVMGEMAQAVAHGIRNPLATIRTSAELALDGDAQLARKGAQDIINQVDRLSYWIRDLLVFSRPPEGEAEQVDMAAIIREAVNGFTTRFERGGIQPVVNEPPVGLPKVFGNRALFMQAFNSLIANAIEAMPQGGTLTISSEVDPARGRVLVRVTDTGVGMSEKQLAQAFKPFVTTKTRGLGVGLALVKRIIERYGGTVALESRENQGTRIDLVLNPAY